MGGTIIIDPSIGLAGIILAVTMLVIIWQLLGHGAQLFGFIYREFIKDESSAATFISDSQGLDNREESTEPAGLIVWLRALTPWLRYGLLATYLLSIFVIVRLDYSIFSRKIISFDKYLVNILDMLTLQSIIVCTACLLWCYAGDKLRRILIPGLFILLLDVLIDIGWQLYQYRIFHWVQLAEVLVPGVWSILPNA